MALSNGFPGRWRRLAAVTGAILSLGLLGSCGAPDQREVLPARPGETAVPPPLGPQLPDVAPGEDFYDHPEDIPPGEPGRLIRIQALDLPGAQGWRVLYHSEAVDGRAIIVSGLVYAPDSAGEPGSRPVIAWGHGTRGLGDLCAASRLPGSLSGPLFAELMDRGFVVAATDYEGLGTPGVHPWLVGQSAGRGILDIVRAAGQIPGSGAGNRFLALGGSQGGGAVLFAGEMATAYAGELELLGVVAVAPAAELDLLALLPRDQGISGIHGFLVMGALGFAAAYPELPLEAVLRPEVIAQRGELETLCADEIERRFRNVPQDSIVVAAPGSVDRWAEALEENTPGRSATGAPVLLVHGDQDRVVPVEISELLFARLCRLGVNVEKLIYAGADHGEVLGAAGPEVLEWITAREQGQSPGPRAGVTSC
ncbi:MAG TPA: lipase family protein [Actinomycetota bacterium]|nr:lipase family protein [Actinomycetota bacterium]